MFSSDRQQLQNGFTLIEIMIVVFIISLLMMVTIPSYQNYVVRTKVSAELVHFSPVKTAVTLYYNINGVLPSSNADAGLPDKNEITGDYLKKLEVKGLKTKKATKLGVSSMQVIMTYDTDKLPELGKKKKLIFAVVVKNNRLFWSCKELTNIDEAYRPSQCL